jgi:hypothetical protein
VVLVEVDGAREVEAVGVGAGCMSGRWVVRRED